MPNIDAAGLSLIKNFEGLRLTAYWDAIGECWTIGFGHTGPDVFDHQMITLVRADALLAQDLAKFEAGVNAAVDRDLTPNQFSALVSFAYNVGLGAFRASTLLEMVNAGNFAGAAGQFGRWVHDGNGAVVPGLVTRRAQEAALFAA